MTPLVAVTEPFSPAATPRESAWLVVTLMLVVAGVWLAAALRRWLDRRARVRRALRAQAAERDALGVLEASGFRVVGRQVRQSWGVLADGDELRFTLIADYLVERGGRRWVAEVKTGERGLDLRHGPTRRQLLEYREAFGADGVLLVDAEARRLRSVSFFGVGARGAPGWRRLAIAVAVGIGFGVGIGATLGQRLARPVPATITPARRSDAAPASPTRAPASPAAGGAAAHSWR